MLSIMSLDEVFEIGWIFESFLFQFSVFMFLLSVYLVKSCSIFSFSFIFIQLYHRHPGGLTSRTRNTVLMPRMSMAVVPSVVMAVVMMRRVMLYV